MPAPDPGTWCTEPSGVPSGVYTSYSARLDKNFACWTTTSTGAVNSGGTGGTGGASVICKAWQISAPRRGLTRGQRLRLEPDRHQQPLADLGDRIRRRVRAHDRVDRQVD